MNSSETLSTFCLCTSTPSSFTNTSMPIAASPLLPKLDNARGIVAVLGISAFIFAFVLICCRWLFLRAREQLRGPPQMPPPEAIEMQTRNVTLPQVVLPEARSQEGPPERDDTSGDVSSIVTFLASSVSPFQVSYTSPTPTTPSPTTNPQSVLLPVAPASLQPRAITPQKSSSSEERHPLLSSRNSLAASSESSRRSSDPPRRVEPLARATTTSSKSVLVLPVESQKSSSSGERQPLLPVDSLAVRSESSHRLSDPLERFQSLASVVGSSSDSYESAEENLSPKNV